MSAPINRMQQLATTVNAWARRDDGYNFPALDQGLVNRIEAGKPRPDDFAAVQLAHDDAVRTVPFTEHGYQDGMGPSLLGYANDLGVLRRAMAGSLGIKEPLFPGLTALWTGIRSTFLGA